MHEPVFLHRAQIAGEHFLRDAADRPLQFFEAARTFHELAHDEHLPFVANQRQRHLDGTGG